jgi:hypothetical protein
MFTVPCFIGPPYIWPWFKILSYILLLATFFSLDDTIPMPFSHFDCHNMSLLKTWNAHNINVLCHEPTCHNAHIIVAHLGPKFIPLHFCEQNDSFHKSSNSNMIICPKNDVNATLISFWRLFRVLWNNFVWLSMLLNLWLRRFGALVVPLKANFHHFLFHHVQLNLFCQYKGEKSFRMIKKIVF